MSSRTETRITQDVPVASSSKVKLSDSPNSVVKVHFTFHYLQATSETLVFELVPTTTQS
jgi:hypothetical protein